MKQCCAILNTNTICSRTAVGFGFCITHFDMFNSNIRNLQPIEFLGYLNLQSYVCPICKVENTGLHYNFIIKAADVLFPVKICRSCYKKNPEYYDLRWRDEKDAEKRTNKIVRNKTKKTNT